MTDVPAIKPMVGSIVHFTSEQLRRVWPAIVTEVVTPDGHKVTLTVFPAQGDPPFWEPNVSYTDASAGSGEARGCWTWPVNP